MTTHSSDSTLLASDLLTAILIALTALTVLSGGVRPALALLSAVTCVSVSAVPGPADGGRWPHFRDYWGPVWGQLGHHRCWAWPVEGRRAFNNQHWPAGLASKTGEAGKTCRQCLGQGRPVCGQTVPPDTESVGQYVRCPSCWPKISLLLA